MKLHSFRYYVYEADGTPVIDFQHKYDAELWAQYPAGRYIVRKDFLGNYPDKRIEL